MVGRISGVGSESDDSVPAFPTYLSAGTGAATSGQNTSGPPQQFALMASCSPRHSGSIPRFLELTNKRLSRLLVPPYHSEHK